MPSRSRFAKRSSTRGIFLPASLVAGTVAAALAGVLGLALENAALATTGLAVAIACAGAFAVYLIVSERRRHEFAEDELQAQATFLEALLESTAIVSSPHEPSEILDLTCKQARQLFRAHDVRFHSAEEDGTVETGIVPGGMRIPLTLGEERLGVLELKRPEPFARGDLMGATVLADFASRAVENARLIAEAREREHERARLTESLITAERDERRRLSIVLHDGPLQSMSGIALMHDAALAALTDGRYDDAAELIRNSLERERDTIRKLRNLSFAIEPLVLRDQGFAAAVRALGEQIEQSERITVSVDLADSEPHGEQAQVALYQLIREAVSQAVQRKPSRIDVTVREVGSDLVTEISDDGVGERRRAGVDDLEQRVRVLNGRLSVDSGANGGTRVRVLLPAYVATAAK